VVFLLVSMFLVASIAMLRERRSGTLERGLLVDRTAMARPLELTSEVLPLTFA